MKPKSYVTFSVLEEKQKTKVYAVQSRSDGDILGEIKWYFGWRQYVFFPADDTIWSRGCLQEIVSFIQKLMDERNKKP